MKWSIGLRHAYVINVLILCLEPSHCFDYCTIKCNKGTHTMCAYSSSLGSACVGYDESVSTMSQAEKESILESHNNYRSSLAQGKGVMGSTQPAAADMMELVWNEEVEEIATRWARQCTYTHDKCRSTKDGVLSGQNLGIFSGSSAPITMPVDKWFEEVKDFDSSGIPSFASSSGKPTGHYTQGVWAKTRKIGCAKIAFTYPPFESASKTSTMLVCNYSPTGNMLGDKIYTEGEACSACPDGLKCDSKYEGLCKNPDGSSFALGVGKTVSVRFDAALTVFLLLLSTLNAFMSGGRIGLL